MTQAVEVAGAPSADGELGAALGPSPAPSRRDRLRAATIEEIIATARRQLVTNGPDAVSLRAIAREMGMTAPGLYRYFGSHEELVRHVIAGIFTELSGDIHQAIEAAAGPAEPTPDQLEAKLTIKMVAACREFRRWALNHQAEFGLLFESGKTRLPATGKNRPSPRPGPNLCGHCNGWFSAEPAGIKCSVARTRRCRPGCGASVALQTQAMRRHTHAH